MRTNDQFGAVSAGDDLPWWPQGRLGALVAEARVSEITPRRFRRIDLPADAAQPRDPGNPPCRSEPSAGRGRSVMTSSLPASARARLQPHTGTEIRFAAKRPVAGSRAGRDSEPNASPHLICKP